MKFLRHLLGITKLDKEKKQCIGGKTGAQNIVKEIKQYQEKWLQHVQRMDTNRTPKQALQYQPKERRNIPDRGRDGGTKFILRIKEQETCPTLHEYYYYYYYYDNDRAGSSFVSTLNLVSIKTGNVRIM